MAVAEVNLQSLEEEGRFGPEASWGGISDGGDTLILRTLLHDEHTYLDADSRKGIEEATTSLCRSASLI